MNVFAAVGRVFLTFLAQTGRLAVFAGDAVTGFIRPPVYWSLIVKQMMQIGYFFASGRGADGFFHRRRAGIADLQRRQPLRRGIVRAGRRAGRHHARAGPVIAGLMVAGRVAAAIAAEIGTMRVTEQIDALTTLATNPIKYLVVPRLVAAVVSMPILVAIADSIGVFGGYIASTQGLGFNAAVYLNNTINGVTYDDVSSGLIKAAVFGFIIALMGCYNGFHSKGGAQGVGAATTSAVVSASILLLAANYILTNMLFVK